MTWRFSDGTEFDGHAVFGGTAFADEARRDLLRHESGHTIVVQVHPPPGGTEDLDLQDPWLVTAWLRSKATRYGLEVTEAPESEAPEDPRGPSVDDDSVIY